MCKQVLALRNKEFGQDSYKSLQALYELVEVYEAEGHSLDAEMLLKKQLRLCNSAPSLSPYALETAQKLAMLYSKQKRYRESISVLEDALRSHAGQASQSEVVAGSRSLLAGAYGHIGRDVQAETQYKLALSGLSDCDRADVVGPILIEFGEFYLAEKRYPEAEHVLKLAVELNKRDLSKDYGKAWNEARERDIRIACSLSRK